MTDTADLTLERDLDAPIGLVWQMWTDPTHFAAWYGPTGATISVDEMDVRVGGRRSISMEMTTPDGAKTMHFVGEYVEVDEPHRVVYTESMADADGAPLPGDHRATQVTVALTERGERTALTLVHAGVAADSPGAMGWNMALDELEARLAG